MAMNQPNKTSAGSGAVVIDSNVLIAICAKEQAKAIKAEIAFNDYVQRGWVYYAPSVVISESLYVLCNKLQSGALTPRGHSIAIQSLQDYMLIISPPPSGDASLIAEAEAIRGSYGCSHSADGLYIALAEELAQQVTTELLTFDQGLAKQAAKNAPTVKVNLLIP